MNKDDFTKACVQFKNANGQPALRALLLDHASVTYITAVKPEDYDAVIAAMKSKDKPAAKRPMASNGVLDVDAIYSHWNSFRHAPRE